MGQGGKRCSWCRRRRLSPQGSRPLSLGALQDEGTGEENNRNWSYQLSLILGGCLNTTYESRREVKELAQLTQGSQAETREGGWDKGDWRTGKRVRRRPQEGSAAVLNGHWSTALSGLTTTSLVFCIPLGTDGPVLLWRVHSLDRSACRKTICPPHPGIPTVKQLLLPDLLSPCLSSQVWRGEDAAR